MKNVGKKLLLRMKTVLRKTEPAKRTSHLPTTSATVPAEPVAGPSTEPTAVPATTYVIALSLFHACQSGTLFPLRLICTSSLCTGIITDLEQRNHPCANGKRSSPDGGWSSRLRRGTYPPGTGIQRTSTATLGTLRSRHGPSYLVPNGGSCPSRQQTDPHACTSELSPMRPRTEPVRHLRQLQAHRLQSMQLLPAQAIRGRVGGQSRGQGPNSERTHSECNDRARLELQPQRESRS